MIQDKQLELSGSQAITTSTTSTNVIDLGARPAVPGVGSDGESSDVELVATVDEAFAAAGAATLTIQKRSSASAGMGSPVLHDSIGPLAIAGLAVGQRLNLGRVPRDALRYMDLSYTVATGPFTAGKLTVRGTWGRQSAR